MAKKRIGVGDIWDNNTPSSLRHSLLGLDRLKQVNTLQIIFDAVLEYPSDTFMTEEFLAWLEKERGRRTDININNVVDILCRINIIRVRDALYNREDGILSICWERKRNGWDTDERGGVDIFANVHRRGMLK